MGLLLDLLPAAPWPRPIPPPPPPMSLDALGVEDGVAVVLAVSLVLLFAWGAAWWQSRIDQEELDQLGDEDDDPS